MIIFQVIWIIVYFSFSAIPLLLLFFNLLQFRLSLLSLLYWFMLLVICPFFLGFPNIRAFFWIYQREIPLSQNCNLCCLEGTNAEITINAWWWVSDFDRAFSCWCVVCTVGIKGTLCRRSGLCDSRCIVCKKSLRILSILGVKSEYLYRWGIRSFLLYL